MSLFGIIASSDKSVPNAPTIGTATDVGSGRTFVSGGRADVTFTAPTYTGRLPITGYTVTSNTGGFTGTGSASPISVTGLTPGSNYTFTVTATNSVGTSAASAASNQITATTIPQIPTITSATRVSNTQVSIAFTGATGGSAITAITATSSPSISLSTSGTSSPVTVTGSFVQGTSYTFTITASNANGTSASSNTSGAVIPSPLPTLGAWNTTGTVFPSNNIVYSVGLAPNGSNTPVWVGTGEDGSYASPNGYYSSNGGSWTALAAITGGFSYAPGNARISTTQGMLIGGSRFGLGGRTNTVQVTNLSTGSAFTDSGYTAYPVTVTSPGVARIGSNVVAAGGENSSSRTYYSAVTGGAWTQGNNFPVTATSITFGTDDASGSWTKGYYYACPSNGIYSLTSGAGAYSFEFAPPWGSSAFLIWNPFFTVNGWRLIRDNRYDPTITTANYLYTDAGFTAVTSMPVAKFGWAGGGYNNVWTLIPTSDRQSTQTQYRATLS